MPDKSHAQPPAHSLGTTNLRSHLPNMIAIHTDIAEPITPISQEGFKYVISFREQKTNLFYTKCIKDLYQITEAIQRYIIAMNNDVLSIQIIPHSTVLHSDSASVYLSGTLKKLLSQHGIISTASSPYHPTANSIVERGWRTVFDLATEPCCVKQQNYQASSIILSGHKLSNTQHL